MNQRQIESFLAVAETGNFTRAAERLYISQPAVSKQVLSLEEELGVLLFVREYHKNVRLTQAGKLYFDFFHETVEKYKIVYEQASQYQKKISGVIRLGILTGWKIPDKLQEVLEQMNQKYPEIEIQLSFADLEPLRQQAYNSKLDIIFTIKDSLRHTNFEMIKLEEMRRVLFFTEQIFEDRKKDDTDSTNPEKKQSFAGSMPESEPDEKREVRDFLDTVFFTVEDGTYDSGDLVREYLKPYGFVPKVKLVPKIEDAVARTYGGMGAMIIDEWSREMKNTSLKHIVLDSYNEAVLAWRKENKNQAVSYFLKELSYFI